MSNMLSLYIRYVKQGCLTKDEYLDKHLKPIGHCNPMDWMTAEDDFDAAEYIADCFFFREKTNRFFSGFSFDFRAVLFSDARDLFTATVLYVHASNLPFYEKNLSSVRSLFTDKKIWEGKKFNFENFKKRVLLKMRDFKVGEEAVSEKSLDYIRGVAHRFLTIQETDVADAVAMLIGETQILEDPLVKEMTKKSD